MRKIFLGLTAAAVMAFSSMSTLPVVGAAVANAAVSCSTAADKKACRDDKVEAKMAKLEDRKDRIDAAQDRIADREDKRADLGKGPTPAMQDRKATLAASEQSNNAAIAKTEARSH